MKKHLITSGAALIFLAMWPALGRYRYLLFDISRTESDDDYGNTFYGEIDVIAPEPSSPQQAKASPPANRERGAE